MEVLVYFNKKNIFDSLLDTVDINVTNTVTFSSQNPLLLSFSELGTNESQRCS